MKQEKKKRKRLSGPYETGRKRGITGNNTRVYLRVWENQSIYHPGIPQGLGERRVYNTRVYLRVWKKKRVLYTRVYLRV